MTAQHLLKMYSWGTERMQKQFDGKSLGGEAQPVIKSTRFPHRRAASAASVIKVVLSTKTIDPKLIQTGGEFGSAFRKSIKSCGGL
jgi:hypothetical protein